MTEATTGDNSNAQLKSVIERVENIETNISEFNEARKDIYTEAKGSGFDVKALRTIVRMRKMDAGDRAQQDAVLETYMQALGML